MLSLTVLFWKFLEIKSSLSESFHYSCVFTDFFLNLTVFLWKFVIVKCFHSKFPISSCFSRKFSMFNTLTQKFTEKNRSLSFSSNCYTQRFFRKNSGDLPFFLPVLPIVSCFLRCWSPKIYLISLENLLNLTPID